MKRKLILEDNNSFKKQKIYKKRIRDEETITDIIPVFKKLKITNESKENDLQKYLRYKRDILIYT
jgi:hypothetical protein